MITRSRVEELKLVFSLNDVTDSVEIAGGTADVKFQPRTGSIPHLNALRLLIDRMRTFGIDTTFVENGKTISAESLLKKIEKKGTWGHVETAELSFQYGVVSSYEHCFITIQEKASQAAGAWETWATSFITLNGFVQAWVSDVEYNHWQNANDPAEYEIAGRDFSRFPMKSNGLPPPVQRLEIDTSGNPGRWVLRSGYVEAIGAIMWLSELFWDRVGRDRKSRVNSAEWLRTSEPVEEIVEVRISERCFISGETADIQNRLRALLYS